MSIELQNITFQYGKKTPLVLGGINLKIKDGTINVSLGLNGCGKTTLIKTMAGLLKANKGEVIYDGKMLKNISIHDRSLIFSYVAQKTTGIDDIIVEDYLTYGMTNSMKFYQSPSDAHYQKAKELCSNMGIDKLLPKRLGEISGGERQVVCLCSALLQNTRIILLDEPLSALDLRNQALVLSTLKSIAKKEGKTLILSDHNPNHALLLECKVALMKAGKIVEYGDAKDIVTIPKLKPIYGDKLKLSKELPYDEISISEQVESVRNLV